MTRASSRRVRVSRRVLTLLLLLLLGLTCVGCGMRNLARTIGEGNGELRASVGGPIFSNLGVPMPLPNLQIGGRYGLTEGFDVDGDISLLGLGYGIVAFNAGAVGQIYRVERGIAISVSGRGHVLIATRGPDLRFFPELGLHIEGPATPWLTVYGGLAGLVQFAPPPGKPPILLAPHVGGEVRFGGGGERPHRSGFVVEIGWINPWQDSASVVSWEPAGFGALYLHLGVRTRFGEVVP